MAATVAVIAAAAVAWLGWCAVLIRREDVHARLRLAEAEQRAAAVRGDVDLATAAVSDLRGALAALSARLDDAERRLQSTIARVGMR